MKYSVYATFFDKKVKLNIDADSEESAIQKMRARLIIDKVTCANSRDELLKNLEKRMGFNLSDILK